MIIGDVLQELQNINVITYTFIVPLPGANKNNKA